jgi:SSS family solute:Na+ symporter/sodium/proline symporter
MLAMSILTGIYLLLGGYVATAINDFIQGIIMLIGIIFAIFFVMTNDKVGGFSEGFSRLAAIPKDGPDLVSAFSGMPLNLLALVILTSLGTWGLPQMVHKFYAIKDDDAIKKATIISTVFAILISGGAYFIGAFGRLFLNNVPPMLEGKPNFDMVMPQVLEIALPDSLMGIIIILVLSASMSTLSSLVLVSSSAISMDLIKGSIYPKMKNETVMLLMRIFCLVFVALSFVVAMTPNAIVTLMSFSWGSVAGAFLAPFLYGLYWKGTTKAGAWAGFISGLACSIGGAVIFKMNGALAPNIGAVSMIVSLAAVPLVSFVTSKLPEAHVSKVYDDSIASMNIEA